MRPMIKVDWLTAGVLLRELAHRLQICQDRLAACWCTADLGWLKIGQLQVPAGVPAAKH